MNVFSAIFILIKMLGLAIFMLIFNGLWNFIMNIGNNNSSSSYSNSSDDDYNDAEYDDYDEE